MRLYRAELGDKMAQVVITIKIMPESPKTELKKIAETAKRHIQEFSNDTQFKEEIEPVAFGLKALKITFVMDEKLGSTESLEDSIREIKGVQSVEVTDVRRAIG